MLTVICGEDTVASRNYFLELKIKYQKQGIDVQEISHQQIEELNKWLADNQSLFYSKKVFFTQSLNKFITKKTSIKHLIEVYSRSKTLELIDWEEEKSARELKLGKLAMIKEFKANQTIFKLLDSCYPNNLSTFIKILHSLSSKIEDGFIFHMLSKHFRNLLIIKSGEKPKKILDWQVWKLKKQAKFWSLERLIAFYEALHRIDIAVKTSSNPFSLRHSLDILAFYFL